MWSSNFDKHFLTWIALIVKINLKVILPDHSLTAAEFVNQECQHSSLIWRTVSLERLGFKAVGQSSHLCVFRMGFHVDLQDLRHIVLVDLHISQMVSQQGFALKQSNNFFFLNL